MKVSSWNQIVSNPEVDQTGSETGFRKLLETDDPDSKLKIRDDRMSNCSAENPFLSEMVEMLGYVSVKIILEPFQNISAHNGPSFKFVKNNVDVCRSVVVAQLLEYRPNNLEVMGLKPAVCWE